MFVFQLVFERRMDGRTNAVNIVVVVIRTNNIPFVFDHHCSPFKMKNTRGRQEEREEGEIGFRLPDEWRQCQESGAPPLEQISLKNSAQSVCAQEEEEEDLEAEGEVAVSLPAVKGEREL